MKENPQYEKDIQFIRKIDALAARNIEFAAYCIVLVACLGAHVLYLILFAVNGVREMVIFNVFSVLFYAGTVWLIRIVKNKISVVYAALAEIILHATYATRCVGWLPDFGMFLLMIIPIVFLMPNKNRNVPFIFLFVSTFLYGMLRFRYGSPGSSLYELDARTAGNLFYIINILIGIFVMVYATSIYTIMNRYTECKLRVQTEQLRILASVDPLTHLNNRRAMNEHLRQLCTESRSDGKHYVIGLGDIDNFKRVNDTYGHDYGDTVLEAAARILTECIPENGFAARWGGEEFLFVIPDADVHKGFECAEQIISTLRTHRFAKGEREFYVTMTFGVCEGVPDDDVSHIITCADKRLYKGKMCGKNHAEYTD